VNAIARSLEEGIPAGMRKLCQAMAEAAAVMAEAAAPKASTAAPNRPASS